ncbi:hypothetical protein DSO57_1027925 [Entomophthora muscae]|uniref:Uncharacterized protein n=1 Tax=Entomophthora muscae TaxID=34485 RepID=A0ACC2TPU4_9FUNG|nr:hypothetical protein DSO57_1027925 [Entomophthora muscae]
MLAWFKKSWVRRTGISLLFTIVWIGVSTFIKFKFYKESFDVNWDGHDKDTGSIAKPVLLHLDLVYRGFEPITEQASLDLTVSLYNIIHTPTTEEADAIKKLKGEKPDLNIVLDGKEHAVILDEAKQITLPLTADEMEGIAKYPVDEYSQDILIEAKVGELPVSFDFTIKQANKDFIINCAHMPTNESKTQFNISLERPWYSKFISILF